MDMSDELPHIVCFICNQDLNKVYAFLKQMKDTEIYLKELLRNTGKMDMSDDMPLTACFVCNQDVNKVYAFLKQMKNTEIYLKEILRNTGKVTLESVEKFRREVISHTETKKSNGVENKRIENTKNLESPHQISKLPDQKTKSAHRLQNESIEVCKNKTLDNRDEILYVEDDLKLVWSDSEDDESPDIPIIEISDDDRFNETEEIPPKKRRKISKQTAETPDPAIYQSPNPEVQEEEEEEDLHLVWSDSEDDGSPDNPNKKIGDNDIFNATEENQQPKSTKTSEKIIENPDPAIYQSPHPEVQEEEEIDLHLVWPPDSEDDGSSDIPNKEIGDNDRFNAAEENPQPKSPKTSEKIEENPDPAIYQSPNPEVQEEEDLHLVWSDSEDDGSPDNPNKKIVDNDIFNATEEFQQPKSPITSEKIVENPDPAIYQSPNPEVQEEEEEEEIDLHLVWSDSEDDR